MHCRGEMRQLYGGLGMTAWLDPSQETPLSLVRPAAVWCCWLSLCSTHSFVDSVRGEGTQFHKLVSRGHIWAEISAGVTLRHTLFVTSRVNWLLRSARPTQKMSVSREAKHHGVWSESSVSSSSRRREKVSTVFSSHGGQFQWKCGSISVKEPLGC